MWLLYKPAYIPLSSYGAGYEQTPNLTACSSNWENLISCADFWHEVHFLLGFCLGSQSGWCSPARFTHQASGHHREFGVCGAVHADTQRCRVSIPPAVSQETTLLSWKVGEEGRSHLVINHGVWGHQLWEWEYVYVKGIICIYIHIKIYI